jgi:hypothetical protein
MQQFLSATVIPAQTPRVKLLLPPFSDLVPREERRKLKPTLYAEEAVGCMFRVCHYDNTIYTREEWLIRYV